MADPLFAQKIAGNICSIFPISFWQKLVPETLACPFYHLVSNEELPHAKHLYQYKNVKQFAQDMDFLLKHFRPLSLTDLIAALRDARPVGRDTFLLTFDDGFREMYDVVAPILVKKGIPATFFINNAFIENKELCYLNKASLIVDHLKNGKAGNAEIKLISKLLSESPWAGRNIESAILSISYLQRDVIDKIQRILDIDFNSYLNRYKPYLTYSQIIGLIKDDFCIGAHSIDHPKYSMLSLAEQIHQTRESIRVLRDQFCLTYGAFAFPHDDRGVAKEFYDEIYSSGLIDISFGTTGMIKDELSNNVQRFTMEKPFMSARKIFALEYVKKCFRILKKIDEVKRSL